jgi:hypothetical protein
VWQSNGIKFDKSTNAGAGFGTDFQLSNVTPLTGYPFICCDYSNNSTRGNVYIAWSDNRGGNTDVWFQRSTNGGANWLAAPVRVNDVTAANQYWPVIQCDNSGNLFVMYYDNRLGASQINSHIAYSTDAGSTWFNQQLSDSSFAATITNNDVRFGDYIGIDAYNGKVIAVWTDQRKGVPNQEIYSATLTGLIGIQQISGEIPKSFNLHQNYPNPFNPVSKIRFDLPEASFVKITVYDVTGRIVSNPVNRYLNAGSFETEFDASKLTSGTYFYKIEAGDFTDTKQMVLVK